MNLPNPTNLTTLREKKHIEFLPLAYYYGWQPRGLYAGLPSKSEILRRVPFELYIIEESQQITIERTDEFLEALEIAFLELERKSNGDSNFEFTSPYSTSSVIKSSFQDLDDLLQRIVQEGMEWLVIIPSEDEKIAE